VPVCDISSWQASLGATDPWPSAVSQDLGQINTDSAGGNAAGLSADGMQLKTDALAAVSPSAMPPRCAHKLRHDYKTMMVSTGIAGAALYLSALDPNGPAPLIGQAT